MSKDFSDYRISVDVCDTHPASGACLSRSVDELGVVLVVVVIVGALMPFVSSALSRFLLRRSGDSDG
jgi:hypothetical protein